MAKISKSFRLSEQAQENLRRLSAQTGSSETAIVEMSLAYFSRVMALEVKEPEPKKPTSKASVNSVIPEPDYPEDGWFSGQDVKTKVQNPASVSSRKRHKSKS